MNNNKFRLLLFITEDWYYWSHRRCIAIAAKNAGYDVYLITRVQKLKKEIESDGINLIPLKLRRKEKNPFREIISFIQILKIYKDVKPSIVHHVALKPVIYGTIISKILQIDSVVNALAGLGHIFTSKKLKSKVIRFGLINVLRLLLKNRTYQMILQNPEDCGYLFESEIVKKDNICLIKGAGVDVNEFKFVEEKDVSINLMLAGRLLWKKGVKELIDAGKIIKKKYKNCKVIIVGEPDIENPGAIPINVLKGWEENGDIIWYRGISQEKMPEMIALSNIIVLPTTYGEGIPKFLLEAASVGRAIIATDVPGCREIVIQNETGILVPVNDIDSICKAIEYLIENPEIRKKMGNNGRLLVRQEFSQSMVVEKTIMLYDRLLKESIK